MSCAEPIAAFGFFGRGYVAVAARAERGADAQTGKGVGA